MFDMWQWGWVAMGMMWIAPLLLFVLLAVLVFGSIRGGGFGARRDTARDILDRRYASGELSREQYEEMKRTLS